MTEEEKKVVEEVNTLFQSNYWLYPAKFTITAKKDKLGWTEFTVATEERVVCVFTLTSQQIIIKLVVVNDCYFYSVLFLEHWTKFIKSLHTWTIKRLMREDRIANYD